MKTQLDRELERLASRVEELSACLERLRDENRALRQRHETLANERATLLSKSEQARTRVEAMIGRLKTLERGA
ncbi:MAG: TIGR02449 family protein [Steroidobacteraceae bacterium]